MKKLATILALVIVVTGCFAQKSNVNKAKSLSSAYENPDFDGARKAIEAALQDPTTKDLTNTWYVAGLVGYNEYQHYFIQRGMGQAVDDLTMSKPTSESYDYWLIADKMSQVPNAKGKVDAKTRKNISQRIMEYYTGQTLIVYGLQLYESGDYMGAYEAFAKHLAIPELDMMQEPKMKAQFVKDTVYYTYVIYAGRFLYMAKQYDKAIAWFSQMNKPEVAAAAKESDIITANEFIYQCYYDQKDTANYVAALENSIKKFPKESWFIQNLINHYIFSGQLDAALEYLNQAIAADPTIAQYYLIRGNLLEHDQKFEEAKADFQKVIDMDPKQAEAYAGMGRCFYNDAAARTEEVNHISDNAAYQKALKELDVLYKASIPYFEKAVELEQNRDYMLHVKGLYYRFRSEPEYQKKYDEITEKLNNM
ncbi:MAG: tetratricopeptide repeat protein [Paludibacteraceae bacterium]|nr:tetratricopeptide repeat protein [Paludibacteraceae bacterium]